MSTRGQRNEQYPYRPFPSMLSRNLRDPRRQQSRILPVYCYHYNFNSKKRLLTFWLSLSRMTRAFWNDAYLLKAFDSTSSETSLLRSPTNSRNHARWCNSINNISICLPRKLTRVPLQECLIFPDFSSTFTKNGCSLTTFGDFPACSTSFINHGSRNIHTLLCQNPHIVFICIGRNRSRVSRGWWSSDRIRRTLVRLMIRIYIVARLLVVVILRRVVHGLWNGTSCLVAVRGTNKLYKRVAFLGVHRRNVTARHWCATHYWTTLSSGSLPQGK